MEHLRSLMLPLAPTQFLQILRVLLGHRVELILVGGLAALVEGAPILTLDVDVVIEPSAGNLQRLAVALSELNARYRDPAGRVILPTLQRLETNRLNLLETDHGSLDVLRTVGADKTYADLLEHTRIRELDGLSIPVLSLSEVIATKEHANREKDRAVLPVLRRTLEVKKQRESEQ